MENDIKLLKQILKTPRAFMNAISFACIAFFCTHTPNLWAGSGIVIDEATGKSLAGVYVYATWGAGIMMPAISKHKCCAFAITQTDKNGKFSLRDFSWNFEPWLEGRTRGVGYYLAGYDVVPNGDTDPPVVAMRRIKNSVTARLNELIYGVGRGCVSGEEEKIKLGPIYRAMYEEAREIATTEEEKNLQK